MAHAIQIIKPENRKFQLDLSELHRISNIDDMKDRYVVVLSIAGAYRKGKSFLLNFFIKFLTAQYKTRSISNWIDGNDESDEVRGFKWRSGRKQETIGIWMWSEVFTHDFDNDEKIAIILLDTQGIFDHLSSREDSTKIFAFSMLLSSVQCYNVMQNIQEDDLENLELFTEYARVAANSNEKPFQELIFIVRDWPYGIDTPYGFSEELKTEILFDEDDRHSSQRKNLQKRITSSINKISIFLMPYPGRMVAEGSNFRLHDIDEKFIDSVKEIAPRLFSPENLVVKKINGQNVRLKDLGVYIEKYVELFNGKTMPEPKSMFMATAEITNSLLYEECITVYRGSMKTFLDKADTFYEDQELMKTHENIEDATTKHFLEKSKFGGEELSVRFLQKLTFAMDEHCFSFRRENDIKRNDFVIKENAAKIDEMAEKYEQKLKELQRTVDTMQGLSLQKDLALNWTKIPGAAVDISAKGNELWVINKKQNIYRWTGSDWELKPGAAVRVGASPDGWTWVVNSADTIYRWNMINNFWDMMPGALVQVNAISKDRAIGVNRTGGIYLWENNAWKQLPGAATWAGIGNCDERWVINSAQQIYRWNHSRSDWDPMPGAAVSVDVQNPCRVIVTNAANQMYIWKNNTWSLLTGAGTRSTINENFYYTVNSAQEILKSR